MKSSHRRNRPGLSQHSRRAARAAVAVAVLLIGTLQSQTIPAPGLSLDPAFFSPNDDGQRDFLVIRPTGVRDIFERPRDWQLEVRDGANNIVRTFAADHRQIRAPRAINNLYLPGSDDIRPVRLFDELIWDGRDDAGQTVPDGVYQLLLRIQLPDTGGFVESSGLPVIVDTSAPQLTLDAPVSVLVKESGSGPSLRAAGERLEIAQQAQSNSDTRYDAYIVNPLGATIRNRSWDDALPERIFVYWDEINATPDQAGHGSYVYRLIASDRAGNRAEAEVNDLLLAATQPTLDLRSERYRFSPNGDGVRDQLALRPVYLNQVGNVLQNSPLAAAAESFRFQILSADLKTVLYTKSGVGAPPDPLIWNGRDDAGDTLSDGLYFAQLRVTSSGEKIETLNKSVWIDTSPPNARLALSRTNIRPDGNGEEEYLKLRLESEDPSGIESWNIRIVLTPTTNPRVDPIGDFRQIYRTFSGTSVGGPAEMYWDGLSSDGIPCESLERFAVEYEVRDRAGNTYRGGPQRLTSGVLFRPIQRGRTTLTSRLPAQNYFDEQFGLTARGEDALNEVLARLTRYGRYNVIIEDHSALPGREESNLEKTEKRARSIYQYFLKQGFPKQRLTYRGHGESELARPEDTNFANYRNDRIEIRLELPRPQDQTVP